MSVKATRTSHVKIMGRWVRVPNWAIMERGRWSTERKNVERDRAARLGELQNFVMRAPVIPFLAVLGFILVVALAIGTVEHSF